MFPLPSEAPDTSVCTTDQSKVVPGISLVNAMEGAVPEQIVCADGVAVAIGNGFTSTKILAVALQAFSSVTDTE